MIYLSTSMQGAYGPHHLFKGVGHHINAVSGYSATTGWPDSDPTMIFSAYSDFIAPWYSLIAIMGALLKRRKTGKGMYIEQAQMECGVSFLAPHLLNCAVNGRRPEAPRQPRLLHVPAWRLSLPRQRPLGGHHRAERGAVAVVLRRHRQLRSGPETPSSPPSWPESRTKTNWTS